MRIVYKNNDDTISILTPTEEALSFSTIEQIAEKDVPNGLPYKIVSTEDIPTDRTFRDAWEWDTNIEADGVGGESDEFPKEVLEKIK